MVTIKKSFLAFGFLFMLSATMSLADVVPVVSADNPVGSLSSYELVNIFLGKTQRFPNGSKVIPIDQAEGSPVRAEFYTEFSGKSAAQVKAHWSKMIFTGRGRPPKMVADGNEVKKQLAENPGAIGYIERHLVDDSVKIVQVIQKN